MNKPNRKTRTGPPRPQQRGRSSVIEGVYNNVHFMHAIATQIGNVVTVLTKSGATFEGIFYTVSPQLEIVLQIAHQHKEHAARNNKPADNSSFASASPPSSNTSASNSSLASSSASTDEVAAAENVFDVLIFKAADVVYLKAKDVDLDYATRDTFQTDTAISRCNGSRFEEKELEPWSFELESGATNGDVDINLDLDGNANGWDVNDMFSINEKHYGVQSTFDQSLSGYTIQIQRTDTQDFRDAEEQAEKIAYEIENQTTHKDRAELENNDENEEDKYAAVERPSSTTTSDEIKVGKYVAPGRRKNNTGKLITGRPSLTNNSNNSSLNNNTSSSSINNNISTSNNNSNAPDMPDNVPNKHEPSAKPSDSKYSTLVAHSLVTPAPPAQQPQQQPQPVPKSSGQSTAAVPQQQQQQQLPSQGPQPPQSQPPPPQQQLQPQPQQQQQQPPQQPHMPRIHSQPPLQAPITHKLNGEDQLGNDMKHGHHRRHRSDLDGDRERLDRDRMERDPNHREMIRENRDGRDPRDIRELRDSRDPRDSRDTRDPRDSRDVRDRDPRDVRDPRDLRDPRDMRDPRDPRDPRDLRDNRDGRDARDARNRDSQDVRSMRDNRGPMTQRPTRHYAPLAGSSYSDTVNSNNANSPLIVNPPLGPNIQPHHRYGPTSHQLRYVHNQDSQHVPVQPLILPPASQSQRTRVQRDNEIAELRKFKTSFVLAPSPKDQRRSDQSSQHQNPASMDMRQQSNDDNQKPYQGQVKSYPAHPMKYSSQLQSSTDSVSSSSPASVEGDKRSMPNMGQQQVKPGAPLPTNLSQNQTPEAKPAEQPPQAYQTPTQTQPQSQNQTPQQQQQQQQQQQTPQPQPPQQMAKGPSPETERTPGAAEPLEYQSSSTQTPQQQHMANSNISNCSTPPATSTPQTPNASSGNESATSDKAAPKKFTLNPAAKPFTPRLPVTPNSSRPHTPQTPSTQGTPTGVNNGNGAYTQAVHQVVAQTQLPMQPPQQPTPQPPAIPGQQMMTMAYFVPPHPQHSYPSGPHSQQTRFRKSVASATAVTGAPLVTTPMPQFISPFQQGPQGYQQPFHHQMVRMYHPSHEHQQQMQYLTAAPQSSTPSPGQAHQQQYHQGPQQTATAQYAQAAPQQYMIPIIPNGPQVVTPYLQTANSQPFLVMQHHQPQ